MPRRAAKTDTQQTAIVAALRKAGYVVAITSQLGDGYPDIHVAGACSSLLIEIKTCPSAKMARTSIWGDERIRLLTEDEFKFHASWPHAIPIVFDSAEALRCLRDQYV